MNILSIFDINPFAKDLSPEVIIRFVFNLFTATLVVWLYSRMSKKKEFYFRCIAISASVFLLVYLLRNVKLKLGFALELFAIFGIIRYRTDTIPPKEMTYLFLIIAVSVITALARDYIGYVELLS
jgi:hypothetical protein